MFIKDPCGIVCILVTYAAVFYADYVIIKWVVLQTMVDSLWGAFNVVMFNTIVFLLIMAHVRAVLTDPGTVPLPLTRVDFSDIHSSDSGCAFVNWTVCTRCETYRPPRAHHCRICQRCIRRMDHHCPWINNCVGERNQKYFIQFLLYVGALSAYAITLIVISWLTECRDCIQDIPLKQARIFPLSRKPVLELWVNAVRRKNFKPSVHSVICGEHFSEESYLGSSLNKKLLKKDPVPSIFNFPNHLQEKPCMIRTKIQQESNVEEPSTTTNNRSVQTSPLLTKSLPVVKLLKRKIKTLQQNVKRKTTKIRNMKDLIKHLNESGKSDSPIEDVLMNNFEDFSLELFQNELKNSKVTSSQKRYTQEMKEFALTLYFYSPKAYTFLRTIMNLPYAAMLRKWIGSFNCEVGFLNEVFDFLKEQAEQHEYLNDVALIFDSMAIRSQVVYDRKNDKHCGYVDLGDITTEDSEAMATEAMHSVILLLESALFGMFVSAILVDQIQAIVTDETAVEQVQHQGPYRSYKPKMALLSEVCGREHPFMWLLPCSSVPRKLDTPLIDYQV